MSLYACQPSTACKKDNDMGNASSTLLHSSSCFSGLFQMSANCIRITVLSLRENDSQFHFYARHSPRYARLNACTAQHRESTLLYTGTLQQLKVYLALLSGHQAPHIMGIRLASLTGCISSTRSACSIYVCCHCYACIACSHMLLGTMR